MACTLLVAACERQVEIIDPYPVPVVHCSMDGSLEGFWLSDSVHIITHVDTSDSVIINTRPTLYYQLRLRCGADTLFALDYVNFSGVVTREVYSTNFTYVDSVFFVFGRYDAESDTTKAQFRMPVTATSDTTIACSYHQRLNSGERSLIKFWLRRVD